MFGLKAAAAAALLIGAPAMAQDIASAAAPAISEGGQKIVRDHMARRNADMAPLLKKKRELQAEFDSMLAAGDFDEPKIAATMAEMRGVDGKIVDTVGSSLLALLKILPEADRSAFMKSLTKTPPAAAPAASAE